MTNCHESRQTNVRPGVLMYKKEKKSRHTLVCLSFGVYQYVYAVNPTQIEFRDQNIFTSKLGISRGKKYTSLYAPAITARNPFELYHVKISRKYVASLLIIMQGLEIFPYRRTQFHTNS